MPDRHRLSEHQARAQARSWLEQQHTDAYELVVTLLHYVSERDRTRRTPPPHAGTSRPGLFCGSCGGHRGPHTFHHDQAAHERARRRYDGLCAKAASTGFPEEADACRAKAEQLRAKYGL